MAGVLRDLWGTFDPLQRTPPVKSPKPQRAKTRMRGDRPRIIYREQCDHDNPALEQRYSHQGGSFAEAGYTAGQGTFGFQQTDLNGG